MKYLFIGALIALIIVLIIIWLTLPDYYSQLQGDCNAVVPVVRGQVYFPNELSCYEFSLAQTLLDICFVLSFSNCPNVQVKVPSQFTYSKKVGTLGYVLKTSSFTVFVFLGTFTRHQVDIDLDYPLTAAPTLNNYLYGVECHRGFYYGYLSIRDQLWSEFKGEPLIITGHSLGGALSTVCAYDFARFKPVHYSFAAPRSGNVLYANTFNSLLPHSFRINNTEDYIPQMPSATYYDNTYQHTNNNIPFTVSLGTLSKDHVEAYYFYMPRGTICIGDS